MPHTQRGADAPLGVIHVFDMDGTLCIPSAYRESLLNQCKPFHLAPIEMLRMAMSSDLVIYDSPIYVSLEKLARLLLENESCAILTSRMAFARRGTTLWLRSHGLASYDKVPMMMRPVFSRAHDNEYKLRRMIRLRRLGYEPILYDDHPEVIATCRDHGFEVHEAPQYFYDNFWNEAKEDNDDATW